MPRYNVEYAAYVYVSVPVDAADRDAAEAAADKILPKYPVVAELAEGCPPEIQVIGPGKDWQLNDVFTPDGEAATE